MPRFGATLSCSLLALALAGCGQPLTDCASCNDGIDVRFLITEWPFGGDSLILEVHGQALKTNRVQVRAEYPSVEWGEARWDGPAPELPDEIEVRVLQEDETPVWATTIPIEFHTIPDECDTTGSCRYSGAYYEGADDDNHVTVGPPWLIDPGGDDDDSAAG